MSWFRRTKITPLDYPGFVSSENAYKDLRSLISYELNQKKYVEKVVPHADHLEVRGSFGKVDSNC
jgi:hypothetical protein